MNDPEAMQLAIACAHRVEGRTSPRPPVYAAPKDFNEQKKIQGKLLEDLAQLGQEVVILARFLQEAPGYFRPENLRVR